MIDVLRAFPNILKMLDADNTAIEQLVFVAWSRSVDGAMAENVVPIRMDGKRLLAAVPNETWRRQVADLGPALADKVNGQLGTPFVSFIEFRIDPDAVHGYRSRPKANPDVNERGESASDELDRDLKAAADSISDESLRSIFLGAAGESLARQERCTE